MAKALNPLSSEKASGSVGRVVTFKPRRTIQTVARKSAPAQPQTSAQKARRAAFTQVTRDWASVSSAHVALWEEYARSHPIVDSLGNQVILPAYDAFVKASLAQQFQLGFHPPLPMPANEVGEFGSVYTSLAAPGVIRLYFTNTFASGAGSLFGMWLQGPLANRHRALRKPEQRLLEYINAPASQYDYTSLVPGEYYYVGVQYCPSGAFDTPVKWWEIPVTV